MTTNKCIPTTGKHYLANQPHRPSFCTSLMTVFSESNPPLWRQHALDSSDELGLVVRGVVGLHRFVGEGDTVP